MNDFPTVARFIEREHDLGIYRQRNEDYHASEGVSRSGLWTILQRTPRHFREGERNETKALSLGSAAHTAVLEPETFEARYHRGAPDRRGKKWDEAQLIAAEAGQEALTFDAYDAALVMRDRAHASSLFRTAQAGAIIEHSAFVTDDQTGLLLRVRPDAYSTTLRVILDIKTAADASAEAFAKSVANYGYHMQEATYGPAWEQAGGGQVDGTLFFVLESEAPYMMVPYELEPSAYREGAALFRRAMDTYAQCVRLDRWPGYPEDVQRLDIPRWAYRETAAPPREGEEF